MADPYWQLIRGDDGPPHEVRELRAGPVTAGLDGTGLRYVRYGQVELARRIYVAVRDCNWGTVPGVVGDLVIDQAEDRFEVRFGVRHEIAGSDFTWQGHITGEVDGRIAFAMRGRSRHAIAYNRIGLCVLLPCRETAGRPMRAKTPVGPWSGALPAAIGAQRIEDGVIVGLHPPATRLEVDLESSATLALQFDGDLFETEDQRNWTDASFKTYSTPLALGVPRHLDENAELVQSVTLHLATASAQRDPSGPAVLVVGNATGTTIPSIGLGLASPVPVHSGAQITRLVALGPAHLRFDCRLESPSWRAELVKAIETCVRCSARLELALFCRTGSPDLDVLAGIVRDAPLARILVFPEGATTTQPDETTPGALVAHVRDHLGGTAIVAGGTDMNFCELNRTRPETSAMDGIAWSMNPQVHAFDDASVLETPEAQGAQVNSAHLFAPGTPTFVGPVTLRARRSVHSARDEALAPPADPRQPSLLASAFTLASLKYLADAGTDAITYFETVGPRGVLAAHADDSAPGPGEGAPVFPLYHPLADLMSLAGAEIVAVQSSQPLQAVGLAARRATGTTLLVANMTPGTIDVELGGIENLVTIRRLHAASAERACQDPASFRATSEPFSASSLQLAAYETVRLDTVRLDTR